MNVVQVNLIYPATERHVRKHTDQNFHIVVETKEAYRMITKPYIDSILRRTSSGSTISWSSK